MLWCENTLPSRREAQQTLALFLLPSFAFRFRSSAPLPNRLNLSFTQLWAPLGPWKMKRTWRQPEWSSASSHPPFRVCSLDTPAPARSESKMLALVHRVPVQPGNAQTGTRVNRCRGVAKGQPICWGRPCCLLSYSFPERGALFPMGADRVKPQEEGSPAQTGWTWAGDKKLYFSWHSVSAVPSGKLGSLFLFLAQFTGTVGKEVNQEPRSSQMRAGEGSECRGFLERGQTGNFISWSQGGI